MATYRVDMPDGSSFEVEGPDNASDEQLQSAVSDHLRTSNPGTKFPQAAVNRSGTGVDAIDRMDGTPKADLASSILQGATFGLSDEIIGGAGAIADAVQAPFRSDIDFNPAKSYQAYRDRERDIVSETRKAYPWISAGSEVGGSFLTGLPGKAIGLFGRGVGSLGSAIKEGAKLGAAQGALSGFGYGEGGSGSTAGALFGGALGAGLGGAAPLALSLVSRPAQAALNYMRPANGLGRDLVARALKDDAVTPRAAAEAMQNASQRGVPLGLMDMGDNVRGLAGAVSRQPGAARRLVRESVGGRQAAQGERVRQALERDLGPVTNMPAGIEAARQEARDAAGRVVSEAEGGVRDAVGRVGVNADRLASGGQARTAFDDAYAAARRRSNEAYQAPALQNPQPIEIPSDFFARDLRAAADDFYGDGGGYIPSELQTIIDDAAAPNATTRTLTNIDRRLADFAGQSKMSGKRSDAAFADRLRVSLGEFTDRAAPKEYRDALANAKAVRAEQGRVYETRDLPQTFARDQYRQPTVGDTSVPERLARPGSAGGDTADSLIEAVGPERAEQFVREELRRQVESIGDLTPANTAALRGRYSELLNRFPSLARDLEGLEGGAGNLAQARAAQQVAGAPGSTMLEQGALAPNMTADAIGVATSGLNPAQMGQYAQGYRNALAENIGRRVTGGDKVGAMIGTPRKQGALAQVFGENGNFPRFADTLGDEAMANETYRQIMTNSMTADRQAFDRSVTDASLLEDVAGSALKGLSRGGLGGAAAELINTFRDAGRFGGGATGQRTREEVAALLSETDPIALGKAMRDALRQSAKRRVGERAGRKRAIRAGMFGSRFGGAVGGYSLSPNDR